MMTLRAYSLGMQARPAEPRRALVRNEKMASPAEEFSADTQRGTVDEEFGAEALGFWMPEAPQVYSCKASVVQLDTVYNFSVPFRLRMNLTVDSLQGYFGGGIFNARSPFSRLELQWNHRHRLEVWLCKGLYPDCIALGAEETNQESLLMLSADRAYSVIIEWNGTTTKWLIDGILQGAWHTDTGFGAVAPKLCYTSSISPSHVGSHAGGWHGNISALDYSRILACSGAGLGLDEPYNFSNPFRLSFEVMGSNDGAHHGQIFSARRSGTALHSGTAVELSWSDSDKLVLALCNGTDENCTQAGYVSSESPSLSTGQGYVVMIEWNGTLASWSVDGVLQRVFPSTVGFGVAFPILCRPPSNDLQTGWRGQVTNLHFDLHEMSAAVKANTTKANATNVTASAAAVAHATVANGTVVAFTWEPAG